MAFSGFPTLLHGFLLMSCLWLSSVKPVFLSVRRMQAGVVFFSGRKTAFG